MSRSERRTSAPPGLGGYGRTLFLLLTLIGLSLCLGGLRASAVTPAQVASANSAIGSAFASTLSAEKSGGNVSSLVAQLNSAIQLVQRAEEENATSPGQAAADLQNASAISQSVTATSSSVAQAGSSARQTTEVTSVAEASAIIIVAALTYVFGGRVYRSAWLRLHRDYVVRPANG